MGIAILYILIIKIKTYMFILGVSAYYHDSAAALIKDGRIIAAAQEERFTRKKNDPSFPANACHYCLSVANIEIVDLDYVVFYDKPFLKFERLIESYFHYAPKGLYSFITAMPIWLKEKLYLKTIIRKEISRLAKKQQATSYQLLFSEHHLSHAASAYFCSPFSSAVIVTLDGIGEWATTSIFTGNESKITILKELHYPNSIGLLYASFTYFLGFKVNSGEYKLMGLAPYGNRDDPETQKFIYIIEKEIVVIEGDGSFILNEYYFSFMYGLRMINVRRWEKIFGIFLRKPESEITQQHCNLAYAVQYVTEKIILLLVKEAKRMTGESNLCLAGGVALNCVANGKILNEKIFKDIYIQPASGDAGGSIGAALVAYYLMNKHSCKTRIDEMKGSLLGPEFCDHEIELELKKYSYIYEYYDSFKELADICAKYISEGMIVGWFQGRMEFGPRALGNRSILADPRLPNVQQKINECIKLRETFRPFAPSVLEEDCCSFFNLKQSSPYMLYVSSIRDELCSLPANKHTDYSQIIKMQLNRSTLPAVTHVDNSARIQTVDKSMNPRYRMLLEAFKSRTGCGVLLNTSFNIRGEPIVCTPKDAIRTFNNAKLDILVLNNHLVYRR